MYLHGEFYNNKGQLVRVEILTNGDRTEEVEIGGAGSGVSFADEEAVVLKSNVSDTFDTLLSSDCTITLQTDRLLRGLYAKSTKEAKVNVLVDGEMQFAGYIQPQTYNQEFVSNADDLEINCTDALGVTEYGTYQNAGSVTWRYSLAKSKAGQRTFKELLKEAIETVTEDLDIVGGHQVRLWYDGNKAMSSAEADKYGIFDGVAINDLLILGEERNDVWTYEELLEEMMRYLNLHILQVGMDFYIFDWASVKKGTSIEWKDLLSDDTKTTTAETITIEMDNAEDDTDNVTINETFNKISIKYDTTEVEELVESPLDSDGLGNCYTNMQKYMTSIVREVTSSDDALKMGKWYEWTSSNYFNSQLGENEIVKDWYVRTKSATNWIFPFHGSETTTVYDKWVSGQAQWVLPNQLGERPRDISAALIALGSTEYSLDGKDNSVIKTPDMSDYLVISVNGENMDDSEETADRFTEVIKQSMPVAVYSGAVSGSSFSPVDDETTNYIVISGSMRLQSVVKNCFTWYEGYQAYLKYKDRRNDFAYGYNSWTGWCWHQFHSNGGAAEKVFGNYFYSSRYWTADSPTATPSESYSIPASLVPPLEEAEGLYEYNYSAIGEKTDTISKVGVLQCMLIIGDKCVVEVGNSGKPDDYEWHKYKPLAECADEDEYYQQSFTIGFDPAIGDMLLNTDFEIQDNVDKDLGIEADGTAIPIKRSDAVSGAVQFIILGPANILWDKITRRHPTLFRHTSWSTQSVPLLAHVSAIYIKDFEVKVYSDNGMVDEEEDNDIVYTSDVDHTFVNGKEADDNKIGSALTSAECQALGVANKILLGTAIDTSTGLGLLSTYDYGVEASAKPEQLYVDAYYKEYVEPRAELEHNIADEAVTPWTIFVHQAVGETPMYVYKIDRDLSEGVATVTVKER